MKRFSNVSLFAFALMLSSSSLWAAIYEQEVMSDKPFLYYRFEEDAGSEAIDLSGNDFHGEYVDGVELGQESATPGLGKSALFDGSSGYVQVPILDFESPQMTIETWINLEILSGGCCTSIFSPDGWQTGWVHYNLKGDANIEFALNGGGPNNHNTEPDTVPFEEWTHIASVYDADEAIVQTYVNGEAVDVSPEDFATPQEVALVVDAQIAAWQNTRFLGGGLDEFAIYDSALSPERILAHFEAASGVALPGDYNRDGQIDALDADAQSDAMKEANPDLDLFDENEDGRVDAADRVIWAHEHAQTWIGDSNFDLEFNSTDLVDVFMVGKYETGRMANWSEGDWNGDMLFDSGDFVFAFADGGYEKGLRLKPEPEMIPEPNTAILLVIGLIAICGQRRRIG